MRVFKTSTIVNYEGERAVDAGGPSKDLISGALRALLISWPGPSHEGAKFPSPTISVYSRETGSFSFQENVNMEKEAFVFFFAFFYFSRGSFLVAPEFWKMLLNINVATYEWREALECNLGEGALTSLRAWLAIEGDEQPSLGYYLNEIESPSAALTHTEGELRAGNELRNWSDKFGFTSDNLNQVRTIENLQYFWLRKHSTVAAIYRRYMLLLFRVINERASDSRRWEITEENFDDYRRDTLCGAGVPSSEDMLAMVRMNRIREENMHSRVPRPTSTQVSRHRRYGALWDYLERYFREHGSETVTFVDANRTDILRTKCQQFLVEATDNDFVVTPYVDIQVELPVSIDSMEPVNTHSCSSQIVIPTQQPIGNPPSDFDFNEWKRNLEGSYSLLESDRSQAGYNNG